MVLISLHYLQVDRFGQREFATLVLLNGQVEHFGCGCHGRCYLRAFLLAFARNLLTAGLRASKKRSKASFHSLA